MSNEPELQVDEDGFVALVAADSYRGFVAEDWELEDVFNKFVEQMNNESAFVAYPGPDGADCPVEFADSAPSDSQRSVSGIVEVGAAGLWFTDYTQLTMAAQFEDSEPVANWSTRLPLEPGRYQITLHQISADDEPSYVLSATPAAADSSEQHTALPWYE